MGGLSATEAAGEQADGEGAEGHHAQAVLAAYGHEVRFDFPAVEQVVLGLQAGEGFEVVGVAGPEGLHDLMGIEVAASDVADLALAYEVV